jgi:hypothetical protein
VPGEFPRVDSAEQRARDADRRGILEDELKSESRNWPSCGASSTTASRSGAATNAITPSTRTVGALRDSISRSEKMSMP